jgi:hypothetical protein
MGAPPLCFIHIMKTGGWSLSTELGRHYEPHRRYPRQGLPASEMRRQKTDVDLLLSVDRSALAEIDLFSLHMPAWVSKVVAPEHRTLAIVREPVARTVSHLRQLASMAKVTADLETLYDHPVVRPRLANFQARMLGMTEDDHRAPPLATPPPPDDGGPSASLPADLDLFAVLATRVRTTDPVSRAHLDVARRTVEEMDLVLTTESLDRASDEIRERLDIEVAPLPYLNVTGPGAPAEGRLERRIREDSEIDLELYEYVRSRSMVV